MRLFTALNLTALSFSFSLSHSHSLTLCVSLSLSLTLTLLLSVPLSVSSIQLSATYQLYSFSPLTPYPLPNRQHAICNMLRGRDGGMEGWRDGGDEGTEGRRDVGLRRYVSEE